MFLLRWVPEKNTPSQIQVCPHSCAIKCYKHESRESRTGRSSPSRQLARFGAALSLFFESIHASIGKRKRQVFIHCRRSSENKEKALRCMARYRSDLNTRYIRRNFPVDYERALNPSMLLKFCGSSKKTQRLLHFDSLGFVTIVSRFVKRTSMYSVTWKVYC